MHRSMGKMLKESPQLVLPILGESLHISLHLNEKSEMATSTTARQDGTNSILLFYCSYLKNVQHSSMNVRGCILQSAHTVVWALFLKYSLYNICYLHVHVQQGYLHLNVCLCLICQRRPYKDWFLIVENIIVTCSSLASNTCSCRLLQTCSKAPKIQRSTYKHLKCGRPYE